MAVKYDLEDRLIDFAVEAIEVVENLPVGRVCTHLGDQLLRSATSAALNYGEALGAESNRDFIHKLKVVLKELRESNVCLRILARRSKISANHKVLIESNELIAIFVKSIMTAKRNSGLKVK